MKGIVTLHLIAERVDHCMRIGDRPLSGTRTALSGAGYTVAPVANLLGHEEYAVPAYPPSGRR